MENCVLIRNCERWKEFCRDAGVLLWAYCSLQGPGLTALKGVLCSLTGRDRISECQGAAESRSLTAGGGGYTGAKGGASEAAQFWIEVRDVSMDSG